MSYLHAVNQVYVLLECFSKLPLLHYYGNLCFGHKIHIMLDNLEFYTLESKIDYMITWLYNM